MDLLFLYFWRGQGSLFSPIMPLSNILSIAKKSFIILFLMPLIPRISLPLSFFSCRNFSLAVIFLLPRFFSNQNCSLDNIFIFLVSKNLSCQDFHFSLVKIF